MYANIGDNGNGNFSFSSTKQLKDKTFSLDQDLFDSYLDSVAMNSNYYMDTASAVRQG